MNNKKNRLTVVLGTHWGDEGKGKLVDFLSEDYQFVARCQGGNNAGHTVVTQSGEEYKFHMLPSALANPHVTGILGNGVVIHLQQLKNEIDVLKNKAVNVGPDRLKISDKAHIVFDYHQQMDDYQEDKRNDNQVMLGTTKKGIGPAYASKISRFGIRMADLVVEDFDNNFVSKFKRLHENLKISGVETRRSMEQELEIYKDLAIWIRPYIIDTVSFLQCKLKEGSKVLVEGANATGLDIDFGTYPYVTSSNCSIGGVCTGLGIPPNRIGDVFGVIKAYTTRVGQGPFPTKIEGEIGEYLQKEGHEFGTTTGRPRMCGWLDLVLVRYTNSLNGYKACALTKLDILDQLNEIKIGVSYKKMNKATKSTDSYIDRLPSSEQDFKEIEVNYITLPGWRQKTSNCRRFEDLPTAAQQYIKTIEAYVGVPIRWIGVGQSRDAIIERPEQNEICERL